MSHNQDAKRDKKTFPPNTGDGKVLNLNPQKQFGFIKVDGEFENIYFHMSLLYGIKVGDTVTYKIDPTDPTRAETLHLKQNSDVPTDDDRESTRCQKHRQHKP